MREDERTFQGFTVGILLGLITVVGCASSFAYKYYATAMPNSCYEEGTLLGKSGNGGWSDLPLKECEPDPKPSPGAPSGKALKCITMLDTDFYELKADDQKCHADLNACQKGPQP